MTTPIPEGEREPFAEAAGEAVQTSVMAVRLILAIADAVRRHQQRQNTAEVELPPAEQAISETSGDLQHLLPLDIATALMEGADWPQMAQQLLALRRAGVDLADFLPRVGEIAVTVRDAAAANAERVARERTTEWVKTLRETLPAGTVRQAILSSPTWPDIAATMTRLEERSVDVRKILASAHDEGIGVDQAVGKVLGAKAAPTTSPDALRTYGPLTIGLDVVNDLDLSDRPGTLTKLAIADQENARYARMVREAMGPGLEREADLLVAAEHWPLIAARMAEMEREKKPVKEHLARLATDTSWEQGPGQLGTRLVHGADNALRQRVREAYTGSGAEVNTTAARAQSATVDPTKGAKTATSTEPSVAAHRATGPAPKQGKTK